MRIKLACAVMAMLTAVAARADDATKTPSEPVWQRGDFGLGAIVGEPTGVSAKWWLTDRTAIDAAAAWSFGGRDSFHLHGDYLFHMFDVFPVEKGEMPFYFGVGGRVKFREDDRDRVGVRGPVGVAYRFADLPLELFAEVAPVLDVAPRTRLDLNGGIGIRYYFR
jgi:hypothetical protein